MRAPRYPAPSPELRVSRRHFLGMLGAGAGLSATGILLAACGGGSSAPSQQATTAPSTASTTTAATTPGSSVGANPTVAAASGSSNLAATQTLRYPNAEPNYLDPNLMTGRHEILVGMSLFDPLLTFDSSGKPIPLAAEKWTVSSSGAQYTFTIRSGMQWSDGHPVTAHDFEYSWKRALTPSVASGYASALYPIKGALDFNTGKNTDPNSVSITAPDDYTLQVATTSATPYFLHICSTWTYLPVPNWAVTKYGDKWVETGNMVSNGMFRLKSWSHDQEIILLRNDTYWGKKATLQQISMPITANPYGTEVKDYEANALDIADAIGPSDIGRVKSDATLSKAFHHFAWSGTGMVFFDCGNTNSPVSKEAVRQALYLAINDQALTSDVLKGIYDPAPTITPPDIIGYDPSVALTGGVSAAKQKLTEAGYPDGKGFPSITLAWPADARYDLAAQALQQVWKQNLNITVKLERMQAQAFNAAFDSWAKQHYDAYISRWGSDYEDPYDWYATLWTTEADFFHTRWHNTAFDTLVATSNQELDPAKRKSELEQAEQMLMTGLPAIPLYHLAVNALIQPYVNGFTEPLTAAQWWGIFGNVSIVQH